MKTVATLFVLFVSLAVGGCNQRQASHDAPPNEQQMMQAAVSFYNNEKQKHKDESPEARKYYYALKVSKVIGVTPPTQLDEGSYKVGVKTEQYDGTSDIQDLTCRKVMVNGQTTWEMGFPRSDGKPIKPAKLPKQ